MLVQFLLLLFDSYIILYYKMSWRENLRPSDRETLGNVKTFDRLSRMRTFLLQFFLYFGLSVPVPGLFWEPASYCSVRLLVFFDFL